MKTEIAMAGAGFACAVLARELAESGQYRITVFDERPHVAGNCHTRRDETTQVMLHDYGPHIFNTSNPEVWSYIQRWSTFGPYINRVKAHTARGVFALPLNLLTINQFFGKRLGPTEAREFIGGLGDSSIGTARNFEEQALKFLGRELYENFFYGYTRKQWGVEPRELPASILQRLPVRFNYDDNYYNQKFQGIPIDGYTAIVEKILAHPDIEVRLGARLEPEATTTFDHVFWSGPLDAFFRFALGRLRYRTLRFERQTLDGDFQGNAVINYCEQEVPYTRITEHKHFTPWEEHDRTVCFREYSADCGPGDTPFYPMRLTDDKRLLELYLGRAESRSGVTFLGRLGTYRYLDMHMVIGESLELAKLCLANPDRTQWPRFSARPL